MMTLSVYLMALDSEEERDKLTLIYEKYYKMMRGVALRYMKDTGAEDDIVHEAILKIIDHIDGIDLENEQSTKCFICTVVKNKARDWWRKETRLDVSDITEEEYQLTDEEMTPLDAILSRDGYEKILGYIGELSDVYKDVCNLKFVCGMKEREIAEVLGITPKNVSVRIVRGRQKLIARIREENHD